MPKKIRSSKSTRVTKRTKRRVFRKTGVSKSKKKSTRKKTKKSIVKKRKTPNNKKNIVIKGGNVLKIELEEGKTIEITDKEMIKQLGQYTRTFYTVSKNRNVYTFHLINNSDNNNNEKKKTIFNAYYYERTI